MSSTGTKLLASHIAVKERHTMQDYASFPAGQNGAVYITVRK